ncbi:transposase family protein [Actinomadura sp. LCR2-06]|uniref:Transposase family protein n=1 Tax=Actinomadura violacea TaxID=2819934 RepID=A0ABS3RN70_9ACTN|nr:transposase family protein [Actinomadura violacea]
MSWLASGLAPVPGRTTVYRVLVRNGLVQHQEQNHRRVYRRWQRDAPMQLWQMDIMGGVFLADGRECKLVTGIDDHSRFIVIAQVVAQPSGRAVCQAFTDAMSRYGVPSEVLSDNGKQFTGRFTKPFPAEVMFERICRENGITARLTKPRSPTTTGKIERWHKTFRRELLDAAGPFELMQAAQQAVDAWVHGYNHSRPHQSLDMATPAEAFRPTSAHLQQPTPAPAAPGSVDEQRPAAHLTAGTFFEPAVVTAAERHDGDAVEIDMVISPGGRICLPANQQFKFSQALVGRPVAVWATIAAST